MASVKQTVKKVLAPIEREVKRATAPAKKLLSPLREQLREVLGDRKARYDSKYGRYFQVQLSQAICDAITGTLGVANIYTPSLRELPSGSKAVIKSMGDKVSRLIVAALNGELHDDSATDIAGYATMLAGLVSGKLPEEILEQ